MHFVTKKFLGYPFAHRVHNHDGLCKKLHGHSWDFEVSFTADSLDEKGFVIDLGKLQEVRSFFEQYFDHTVVLAEDDPLLDNFRELQNLGALKLLVLPHCSSEAIAEFVANEVGEIIKDKKASVSSVLVRESFKNSATYVPDL